MANISRLAKRYARALFSVTQPANLDRCSQGLAAVAELWDGTPELREALQNPAFPPAERREALLELARRTANQDEETVRLVGVMFDNGRLEYLSQVAAFFVELVALYEQSLALTMVTAQPIDDHERWNVRQQLAEKLGRDLSIEWEVDPALIGGATIRVGDKVLDGSVKGMLERAVQALF